MTQFQSAKKMRAFYNRLNNERHLSQDQRVDVSISRAVNVLKDLLKGLKAIIPESSGFYQHYAKLVQETLVAIDKLTEKQGSIQLALFGHKDKSALIQEALNIDFPLDYPCMAKRYQFKGLISGQLQLQRDHESLIFSEDFGHIIDQEELSAEAQKAVLLDQLIALQDAFQDDQKFLAKVQEDYDKRVHELESGCNVLKHFLNHELLVAYSFVDVMDYEDLTDLYTRNDGLIYVMDHTQLYYQKEEDIIGALKHKKSIGLLLTDEEGNPDKLKNEVNNRYDNVFSEVMVINRNTFDKDMFINLIDRVFDADYEAIKYNSKVTGFDYQIKRFKSESRKMTKHLVDAYNHLAVLKNELSTDIAKEHNSLNSKVLWLLNNYEMRIKFGIEDKVRDQLSSGDKIDDAFVTEEIFMLKDFKEELYNLKRNLIKMVERFFDKNRVDFNEDFNYFDKQVYMEKLYHEKIQLGSYPIVLQEEIDTLVAQLSDRSFRLPFGRKKKILQIQESFLKILEDMTDRLKNAFYEEIQGNIDKMNRDLYEKLEEDFINNNVETPLVNQLVRYVDDHSRELTTELVRISVKDMLRHSKRSS